MLLFPLSVNVSFFCKVGMDARIEAYLRQRIEALESVYVNNCLWFVPAARRIIDRISHHPSLRQLERDGVLRDVNLKSGAPMSFLRISEKLERGDYPCECGFMKDCRLIVSNVLEQEEGKNVTSKVFDFEMEMEEMFVSTLNQPRLHTEVGVRLAGVVRHQGEIPSNVQKVLRDYGASADQPLDKVPQAALRALCKILPKPRRMGGGVGPSVNVYASNVIGHSILGPAIPMHSALPQQQMRSGAHFLNPSTHPVQQMGAPSYNHHQGLGGSVPFGFGMVGGVAAAPQYTAPLRGLSPPSAYNDFPPLPLQGSAAIGGGMEQNAQNATFFEDVSPVHMD